MAVLFAITLSIDALAVGISCGLRKRRIGLLSYAVIFMVSMLVMGISVFFGHTIVTFLSAELAGIIGALWIMLLGVWIGIKAIRNKSEAKETSTKHVLIHAFSLAIMLSIDSMGAGLAAAALGINIAFLPFLVAAFQVGFLALGVYVTELLPLKKDGGKAMGLASGLILIVIGIIGLV